MSGSHASSRPSRAERVAANAPEREVGVLIVDDDASILAVLERFLSSSGFAVWTARSGAAAVGLFRQERGRIDVVLLDVRMPGLDGPQTLGELRRLAPDLACWFMSGQTGGYTPGELLALGARGLIAKPFRLDEVAQTLRHAGPSGLVRTA